MPPAKGDITQRLSPFAEDATSIPLAIPTHARWTLTSGCHSDQPRSVDTWARALGDGGLDVDPVVAPDSFPLIHWFPSFISRAAGKGIIGKGGRTF